MPFQPDPTTVRWRIHLRVPPETVYRMVATDAGRAAFWAESAVEREGVVHFRFVNGREDRSPVREARPPDRFALDYFNTRAVFDLEDDGRGGTDLTLTNTGFRPQDRAELLAGWLNVLFPLKAAVDFGVDLRNHDPDRTWDRGYADQ